MTATALLGMFLLIILTAVTSAGDSRDAEFLAPSKETVNLTIFRKRVNVRMRLVMFTLLLHPLPPDCWY